LYLFFLARGKEHGAACDGAVKVVEKMYRRFIGRAPADPQRWFATGAGLRRFKKTAVSTPAKEANAAEYEKKVSTALQRSYYERLNRGSDGKGNFRSERPLLPYIAATTVAAALAAFLFYSESVLTLSFGRFGEEYRLSFPDVAETLWDMSGLVRSDDADPRHLNSAVMVPQPAAAGYDDGHE
jgi:hypothetical protein